MPKKSSSSNAGPKRIESRLVVGRKPGTLTPGFELSHSWRGLCLEILQVHPDLPLWEVCKELRKKGLKKIVPSIRDVVKKVRAALGVTTWRTDQEGDSYVIVPVRMSRDRYEQLAEGGQHVGVILENHLHKLY